MSLRVEGVRKRFSRQGDDVLDGVSFTVPSGSLTCLLGPSGVGKSTVLHIIAGLTAADAGTVHLDGRRLDGVAAHRRPLTMLLQRPHLFDHLDVADNVAFGLRVRGVRRTARRAAALEHLRMVGVHELASRYPRQLSGGEAQRVALARALAVQPSVLLADEPFAGVDGPVRRELQDLVIGLHRELGMTMVVVTHDMAEAFAMGDRLAVLDGGRICDEGTPEELYERPRSERTARLLGVSNRWSGTLHGGRLHVGERCLAVCPSNALGPLEGHRRSRWGIRPDRVRVGCGGANPITGTVTALRFVGAFAEATIGEGAGAVIAHLPADGRWRVGDPVTVDLPIEHLIELEDS